jgi:hypothetical protein
VISTRLQPRPRNCHSSSWPVSFALRTALGAWRRPLGTGLLFPSRKLSSALGLFLGDRRKHSTVMPVFRKLPGGPAVCVRMGPVETAYCGSSLVCASGRTLLNRNRSNRSISDRPKLGHSPPHCSESTQIASEWPVIRPESMPSSEITSYKPTSRYRSAQTIFKQRIFERIVSRNMAGTWQSTSDV